MHRAVLSLGSNKGNRTALMQEAFSALSALGEMERFSTIHETSPWGFETDTLFLNQVVVLQTSLSPLELLNKLQLIEKRLGKDTHSPTHGYASRTMDLDILYYDDLVLNSKQLTLPHPHIQQREFILKLLSEINISVLQ